ncbi:MAG: hypothetical protein F7O42_12505 [Opitutae bacterium]|nr:hypothetical protein [Opitutae bacterium]
MNSNSCSIISIHSLRIALLAGMIFGGLNLALAQEDEAGDEDIYQLSPFQVDESADSGYYASQTLAGGRVRTNLSDVATSVQVITEEFLEDLGATSLDEVLVYTTNTDV